MHIVSFLVHISSHSHWLKFEPCPHFTHGHPHVIHVCDLFTLTYSTLYFPAFLLSFFLSPFFYLSDEQQPELSQKIMENLYYSATNGGEGTNDVLYLPTALGSNTFSAWRVAAWLAASEHYFRKTVAFAQLCAANQVHLPLNS